MNDSDNEPVLSFYRFIPGIRDPLAADKSAGGTLPTRAFRYCEAVRVASSYGWYIFPPMDFELLWDGSDVSWRYDGREDWMNLESVQFPEFEDHFDENAPDHIKGYAPPFLGALIEPGLVQIWTGYVIRTRPGWSSLIRPPVNIPGTNMYEAYEGVVETDDWNGPLFTNVRLKKTGVPIKFRMSKPLIQVQPIPTELYGNKCVKEINLCDSIGDISSDEWTRYHDTIVKPAQKPVREKGRYAKSVRKKN